jgi:predicted type IV restriction endonuclease
VAGCGKTATIPDEVIPGERHSQGGDETLEFKNGKVCSLVRAKRGTAKFDLPVSRII